MVIDNKKTKPTVEKDGIIYTVAWFFIEGCTNILPPQLIPKIPLIRSIPKLPLIRSIPKVKQPQNRTDRYVLFWIAVEIVCFFIVGPINTIGKILILLALAYRYLECMITLSSILLRGFIIYRENDENIIISNERKWLIAILNGIEILIIFSILNFGIHTCFGNIDAGFRVYVNDLLKSGQNLENIWQALYYSAVTATTLGYGDITPSGKWTKFLAVIEVLSFFFIIVSTINIFSKKGSNR